MVLPSASPIFIDMGDSLGKIARRAMLALLGSLALGTAAGVLLILNLWHGRTVAEPFFTFERMMYLFFIALALGSVIRTVLGTHNRIARAVREDIRSIGRMFRDVRHGGLREAYPMALEEFTGVFHYLRDSGRKLVEEKEKLKGLGLIDHLSQLSNRRHFEKRLKELHEASKTHGSSSVLIIDMDHFKAVNDHYGHDIGDALIVAFAKALRTGVRHTDFLARLGGDEFCIVYPYTPLTKAAAYADRLRKQLPRTVTLPKNIEHPLKWTGGLSAMADTDAKFDDVLWRADKALMRAKEAGRNLTEIWPPTNGEKPRLRVLM